MWVRKKKCLGQIEGDAIRKKVDKYELRRETWVLKECGEGRGNGCIEVITVLEGSSGRIP